MSQFEGVEGFTSLAMFVLGALSGSVAAYLKMRQQEQVNKEQKGINEKSSKDIDNLGRMLKRSQGRTEFLRRRLIAKIAEVEDDREKRKLLLNEITHDDESNS